MIHHFIDYDKIPQLSNRDKAYQKGDPKLRAFYPFDFDYDSIDSVIEERRKFPIDRDLLVSELKKPYAHFDSNSTTIQNIESLQDINTFTVITAHQPSLLTGPLYFIIKIASAIHLAKKISNDRDIRVVPIFILGAEDHDFEEVNHANIFGKTISWDREASGSVGRMNKDGLEVILAQVQEILGDSDHAEQMKQHIQNADRSSSTYGEFMFHFVNELFSKYGLIVANFDNKAFKRAFSPIIKREFLEQFSKDHVTKTQEQIIEAGFSDQAYARDINFFYLTEGGRKRFEFEDGLYKVLDSDISFTTEALLNEIDENPDRFSPNVVMRPLYQEYIMPNLGYIGGGGELAYWMERKSQFADAGIFYPMLIRRNSVLWLNQRAKKSLGNLNLELNDLLQDTDQLLKSYALENTSHSIDFESALNKISSAFKDIQEQSMIIDKSLEKKVEAMKANQINGIEKLQGRLVKAMKQNQEVELNKIRKVKDQLFPSNSLQERKTNFLEFYLKHGQEFIDYLVEVCDPFEKGFMVVEED